jgi:hypothetical protein
MRAYEGVVLATLLTLTGCGSWGDPQLIDTQTATSSPFPYFAPRIVAGTGGDPTVVYTHQRSNLRGSRRDAAWSSPASIGPHTAPGQGYDVAVLGTGTAMAIFTSPGEVDLLWSQHDLGVWSAPTRFPEISGTSSPRIVADGYGRALAVWVAASGAARSARFGGAAWGSPHSIGIGDVTSLRLAMSPSGEGIAAWCRLTMSGGQIIANRFSWATGWDGATLLATVPACHRNRTTFDWLPDPATVDVGITDAGLATVLWTDGELKHRRCGPATDAWTPEEVVPSSGSVFNVSLAVNPAGQAIAAWQSNGAASAVVEAAAFSPESDWSGTVPVADHGMRAPRVLTGIDGSGRGFVVYLERATYAARFNGTSFLASELLGAVGDYWMDLAVTESGEAYLARDSAHTQLFVSRYDP